MKIGKIYLEKNLIICIILFIIISCFSINSAIKLLPSYYNNLVIKQIIWYFLGLLTTCFIIYIGNDKLLNNAWYLYGIGLLSLLGLLLFAKEVNNAKCWFFIPKIGGIQPSEFFKIVLIILLAQLINSFHQKYTHPTINQDFLFLCKIVIIVIIPSLLTFLQPDTGVVLIYFIITIFMLFVSGIRYRWFTLLSIIIIVVIATIIILYLFYQDIFIKILGNSFFLRVDRLLNWSNNSGYQLETGRAAIGSGGLFGLGLNNTPIYFPEPQTDFIFAVYANNMGFTGSLLLLIILVYFDISLIKIAKHSKKLINKYIIAGLLGMLIYQQFQNIGMTIGLLPITGITLPFISYGGSSLLSYFIIMGVVFNIANENKYKNK